MTAVLFGSDYNLPTSLLVRTVCAFSGYFLLSLTYSLINLAFGVPMQTTYGHGGFMVFWMLHFFLMAAGTFLRDAAYKICPSSHTRSWPADGSNSHSYWPSVEWLSVELL